MDRMTFVTVYKFKVPNPESGTLDASLRMGTRAAISSVKGEIIRGSGIEVPVHEVDAEGFTTPNPGG
jgi:hypothetical protein